MDYRPNIEGVEWFANEVFPHVRRNHPKVEFWIVGSYPSSRVTKLAQKPAIRVTGRVNDVRPYLSHASCVVAPLHIARGLQNKVLEAMAMARPVIATPAACEGLSAKAGRDLLLAESPDAFASAVSSVVAGGMQGLGHQARLCVEADYNWSRNLKVLDELFQGADGHPSAPEAGQRSAGNVIMRAVS
jgi:glycosyltransferase involved in cell wall biosynthesis